jgi:hypothetical protein
MLLPKIDICINNVCNKIDVYEMTSPYVAITNDTGWGAPNEDTSDITSATLEIYNSTGNSLLQTIVLFDGTVDVYSGVAGAPNPGAFLALKDVTWSQTDGVYKLVYTITTALGTYLNETQYKLFTCNIENCLDKIKSYMVTECNSSKLTKQKEKYDQLQLILFGIQSAFSCKNFDAVITGISSASKICDNLCDCGCGDC